MFPLFTFWFVRYFTKDFILGVLDSLGNASTRWISFFRSGLFAGFFFISNNSVGQDTFKARRFCFSILLLKYYSLRISFLWLLANYTPQPLKFILKPFSDKMEERRWIGFFWGSPDSYLFLSLSAGSFFPTLSARGSSLEDISFISAPFISLPCWNLFSLNRLPFPADLKPSTNAQFRADPKSAITIKHGFDAIME